jgi:hypothetical protein
VAALAKQYASLSEDEMSPFIGDEWIYVHCTFVHPIIRWLSVLYAECWKMLTQTLVA